MNYIKNALFFILLAISGSASPEELVIPITKYLPLSKTISKSIPGSSNIIINQEDLKKYKNTPIQDILDLKSGIKSRSIYGSNSSGSKTTIDIRGMGAQAKSNVLILINGQRLNNIDMSEIDFAGIPIESIDKVEIYKGSSASVLYGDGAIGGAINIITKPAVSKRFVNNMSIRAGSFKYRELSWNYSKTLDDYTISTYFNNIVTDGYRDHNEQQQTNFSSELRYSTTVNDHFFQISLNDQNMNTPGDRSQIQIYTDRKGTDTPDDYIKSDGGSFLYGLMHKINNEKNFVFDGSVRIKDSYSDLQSSTSPSYTEIFLRNYQFTPRINSISYIFGKQCNCSYGVDLQYADYYSHRKENQTSIPLHVYDAWQTTGSIYAQYSIELTNNSLLGAGLRIQKNQIAIGDHLDTNAPDYAGWQSEHLKFSDQETNFAANVGLEYSLSKNIALYGGLSNGFRYPNIDDRIGGSGGTSLELNTQKTKDFEIGTKKNIGDFNYNLSTFIIEGKNELAYDSDAFENINMNSTRRYGVELTTKHKVSDEINISNNFTFVKAQYTSGDQGTYATDFENNQIPLVPPYSIDTSIEWKLNNYSKIISSIKYQDEMRMESDDENFQPKIPSYVIANLYISSEFNQFFSSLSINNIFDETYYNYAVASSSAKGTYNTYPLPGREIVFSIGTRF